jgi:arylsulfatase A-like enzyme
MNLSALTTLFLLLLSWWAPPPPEPPPARPNILLILVDDLGYGDLSGYGARDLRTPHLDALLARGVRSSHFYANSPVCSPTRAALLTGRYPDLVGIPGVIRMDPADNWGYLSPKAQLLPGYLKKAGYHTALVGKWHLGLESPNLPNDRGFDHFQGHLEGMMDDYYTHLRFGENFLRRNSQPIRAEGHATDLTTDWAIGYLKSRQKAKDPFFLYLAYNAPHDPVQPPADWLERVKKREPALPEKRAKLAALIEHLDDGIGKVLAALRANGQADNTLVVFTSDNGGRLSVGASCAPWRGGKEDMYEGGIREPFCAAWPGKIKPGSRQEGVALTMDLMPTLLEAAGVPVPPGLDGVSVLPALLGQPQPNLTDRTLIWVRREGNPRYRGRDYYAVRRGNWKLVQNSPFQPYELYDLAADSLETRNLADANKPKLEELYRLLMAHLQKSGTVPWQKGEVRSEE